MTTTTAIPFPLLIEWGMADLTDVQVLDVLNQPWGEFVPCPRCGGQGRVATTYEAAVNAWNDAACDLCDEGAAVPAFVALALVLDREDEQARQSALLASDDGDWTKAFPAAPWTDEAPF
jgi:hypothetical protein